MTSPPACAPPPAPARALVVGLFALFAYPLFELVSKCAQALRSPYSKDYGEGCVLALTQLLAERGTYFLPLTGYPLVHGIYPPVFIGLNALGHVLLGPSLWFPRMLSILATAVAFALVFCIVRRRTGRPALAAVCALLFGVPWFVQTWAPLARVDMLAIALTLLGLYLATDPERTPWITFAPLVLAFFTKQSALLAPAALLGALLLRPDERPRLPRALLSFAGPLVFLLALLFAATHGEAYRHLFPYTAAADYDLAQMARNAVDFLRLSAPLQGIIVAGLWSRGRAMWRGSELVLVLYWIANLAALSTFAKAGAAQNYFIEPWLASLLLAGSILGDAASGSPRVARQWPAVIAVALLVAWGFQHGESRLPQPLRNPGRAVEYRALDDAVRATTGPILSENLSVLVVNRKPVLVEPFGLVQFARKGFWRSDALVADCHAHFFALVVYEHRLRDIPGLGECLDDEYLSAQELGPYELLRPR